MAKNCDHKSVGVLVWRGRELLMIERKIYNFGYALPAGHLDGDDLETGARRELEEEVGIRVEILEKKLTETLWNPCKREGGTYHKWTIFEAKNWSGEIKPSPEESKSYLWADREKLQKSKFWWGGRDTAACYFISVF